MKKLFLLALCALVLISCAEKRPVVVENPPFEVSNMNTVEVAKIELSDTATVLHLKAFFRAGSWIRIAAGTYIKSSDGDEKLLVTRAKGIELDKEFTMPDSGRHNFTLYFPPLAPDVTRIDFIESDCDDCFKIFGIRLLANDKVKLDKLPDFAKEKSERRIPPMVFSAAKAKVSGRISGYRREVGFNEVTIYAPSPFSLNHEEVIIPVAEDGTLSGEVAIYFPQLVHSSLGTLFLAPNEETKLYVDLKQRAKGARLRKDRDTSKVAYRYMSSCGFSYEDMRQIDKLSRMPLSEDVMKKMVDMSPEDYKAVVLLWAEEVMKEVEQSGQPAEVQKLANISVQSEVVMRLLGYRSYKIGAYARANKINDRQKLKAYKPPVPDVSYYSFLRDWVNDDMLYAKMGGGFVLPQVQGADVFKMKNVETATPAQRYAHLTEKVIPLIGSNHAQLLNSARAKFYAISIENEKFFTDKDKAEIKAIFSENPAYAECLIAKSDELKKLTESKNEFAREVPNVSKEKMFDAILAKYRGKVVVVDFWATWCGPCKQANKEMKPLKAEMQGKDVVFLCLTGETSPLPTWNKMIKEIEGEHYRVSDEQWEYWYEVLKIEGVPTFMIYDKLGKQQHRNVGFSGADVMRREVEKLL